MLNARIDLTLPKELIAELKKTVPKMKRSSFVAEAVEDKLKSITRERAFKELAGSWDKHGGFKFRTDQELTRWRKKLWSSFDKRLSSKRPTSK